MSARRALITGITGQDGSYLAEQLLADGVEVVGVVRPPIERAEVRPGVPVVAADLHDEAKLAAAIADARPDWIFHLAAPTFVPASWDAPRATLDAIAGATATVLEAAGGLGARVVVASSPEVFGAAVESPQTEGTPLRPRTPYGVAKAAAQDMVRVMRERHGLFACAAITYNHESPRRPARFVTRKITRAAAAIALGQQDAVVLGDLEARRDWSHAADVVRGMRLALAADEPGDYVLGSGVARTVREFADAAFRAAGIEDAAPHLRVDPELVRPREEAVLVGDPSRARSVLGWEPEIGFDALVREMVEADLAALRAA